MTNHLYTDAGIGNSRARRAREVTEILQWFNAGAITVGNRKQVFNIPYYCRVKDVFVNNVTASVGGVTNDTIDIKYSTDSGLNWTSIFSATADRPVQTATDTGAWAVLMDSGNVTLQPGYLLAIDVIQVDTTGSALVSVSITLADR